MIAITVRTIIAIIIITVIFTISNTNPRAVYLSSVVRWISNIFVRRDDVCVCVWRQQPIKMFIIQYSSNDSFGTGRDNIDVARVHNDKSSGINQWKMKWMATFKAWSIQIKSNICSISGEFIAQLYIYFQSFEIIIGFASKFIAFRQRCKSFAFNSLEYITRINVSMCILPKELTLCEQWNDQ